MGNQGDLKSQVRQAALRRLDRRESSAGGMRQALHRKGFPKDLVAEVVQELVEKKWIDDEKYTRLLVRDQALRGKGSHWIQMKLRTQGITTHRETVGSLIESAAQTTEIDLAQAVVSRRYPTANEDPTVARKAIQALLRRGFSYEIAKKALATLAKLDPEK